MVSLVKGISGDDVGAKKLRMVINNQRKTTKAPVSWSVVVWRKCHWQRLIRTLPSPTADIPCPSGELSVVDYKLSQRDTVVVLCHVPLAREVLSRLGNQQYIKLCGDGTWRLMLDGWVLITLGTLSKHHATGTSDSVACFRATYRPFLFAIANRESQLAHELLFAAAKEVARTVPRDLRSGEQVSIDLTTSCGQYHGDWHAGDHRFLDRINRPSVPGNPPTQQRNL